MNEELSELMNCLEINDINPYTLEPKVLHYIRPYQCPCCGSNSDHDTYDAAYHDNTSINYIHCFRCGCGFSNSFTKNEIEYAKLLEMYEPESAKFMRYFNKLQWVLTKAEIIFLPEDHLNWRKAILRECLSLIYSVK